MTKIINSVKLCKLLYDLYKADFNRRFIICYLLALIVAIAEVIALSALFPLISVITDGVGDKNIAVVNFVVTKFKWLNEDNLGVALSLLVVFIYLTKNLISVFTYRYFATFAFSVKQFTANNLARYYLHRPFSESMLYNSGELQRDITIESNEMLSRVLVPMVHVLVETFVIIAIGLFLINFNPYVSFLVIILFGSVTFSFILISSRRSVGWGKKRQIADKNRLRLGNEMFQNLAELKLSGKEEIFLERFNDEVKLSTSFESNQFFLSMLPKIVLETVTILFFAITVLLITIFEYQDANLIVLLAIFAAAAFRILPSFNRLIVAINNLSFGKKVIDLVANNFKNLEQLKTIEDTGSFVFNDNFCLNNAVYYYEKHKGKTINIPNLTVNKNEYVGIVGESGSGKSTTLSLITGLLPPIAGNILLDGEPLIGSRLIDWQRSIGYVPQLPYFIDNSIAHNVSLQLLDDEVDFDLVARCLEQVGLSEWVDTLPNKMHYIIGENAQSFSGGQRQRLAIARALYKQPSILVFDEALASLDETNKSKMISFINSLKGSLTIINVTHDHRELREADRVYEINDGELRVKR